MSLSSSEFLLAGPLSQDVHFGCAEDCNAFFFLLMWILVVQKTAMHRAKALASEEGTAQQLVDKGVASQLLNDLDRATDKGNSFPLKPSLPLPLLRFSKKVA